MPVDHKDMARCLACEEGVPRVNTTADRDDLPDLWVHQYGGEPGTIATCAAGVGVPPAENQDSVSAPARERQDAREPRCHRCGGRLPLEGEPYDVRVTDYCCAKCAVEVGAGVGEARPAADASRTVDGRELNPWGVEGSSVQESAAPPRITVAAQRVEHQGRVYIDADDLVASLRAAGWGQLADDFFRWRVGVARPAEPPDETDLVSAADAARETTEVAGGRGEFHAGDTGAGRVDCGSPRLREGVGEPAGGEAGGTRGGRGAAEDVGARTVGGSVSARTASGPDASVAPADEVRYPDSVGAPAEEQPDARARRIAEHLGYCSHSTAEDEAAGAAVLQLVAECGRLREQLDAARQALQKIAVNSECIIGLSVASKHGKFCAYHTASEALLVARAALGDVAAPPNQTTDSVGALRQRAPETREGGNADG